MCLSDDSMDKRPIVIYLHIPKAGGTTLNQIFHIVYQDNAFDTNIERVKDKPRKTPISEILKRRESFDNVDIIFGNHYQFGIHRYLPSDKSFKYVTLLRNPVKRIISHYNHVKSRGNHKLHKLVTENNYNLKDYVSSGITKEVDNGMVRQIIGSKKKIFDCNEDDLNLAISHIEEHFALIGLLEQFDNTLQLFKHKFGWKEIPEYTVLNKKKKKLNNEFTEEEISAAKAYNRLDLKLFAYCKQKFKKELAKVPSNMNS